MRTSLVLILALAACGSDSSSKMDAPSGGGSDAKVFMDAPPTAVDCPTYCNTIMSACTTTALKQYDTPANCMASCSHFAVGAAGTQSGDTLACRSYHASAAVGDPTTHCIHAGPSGAGICGTPCQGFCDLAVAECPTQYPNAGGCATMCAVFTTTPPYAASVTSGDNASCRIYHATAASTNPGLHCPHIVPTGSATCHN